MATTIIAATLKVLALLLVVAKGYMLALIRLLAPLPPKSLRNEVILVTGGSNGIGRGILERIASLETNLTLISWDVDTASNESTIEKLQSLGVKRAVAMTVDITNKNQVSAAAAQVRQEFGNVTMLFNNAGIIASYGRCWETDVKDQERTIQVNFISHFYTLREFLPWMVENNRGHVIPTCSMVAICYFNNFAAYNASKSAVSGYYNSLREDLRVASSNVRVSLVYPGTTNTNASAPFDFNERAPSLSGRVKGLTPTSAGRQIVDGVVRNKENIYVPWSGGIVHAFSGLVVPEVYSLVLDFFGTSDVHQVKCDKLKDIA